MAIERKNSLLTFLATFLLVFVSCMKNTQRLSQPFRLMGPEGKSALLLKIPRGQENKPLSYVPIGKVKTGSSVDLQPGDYFLALDCSGFLFHHSLDNPSQIYLGQLILYTALPLPLPFAKLLKKGHRVPIQCTDPLDGHMHQWDDKLDFELLPGNNNIIVASKPMTIQQPANGPAELKLPLTPVQVSSKVPETSTSKYFASTDNEELVQAPVVASKVGETLWLTEGNYILEINGTKRKLSVTNGQPHTFELGALRIEMPTDFPMSARLLGGGQPIFAYINNGVLLNLNTDYFVFPGEYTVSLEGSDLQELYLVEPGKKTVIHTMAAEIKTPDCPPQITNCKMPMRITIHRDQRPFVLMTAQPGVPFLVLDGKYEYGIEGTRGLMRSLIASQEMTKESFGRVLLKWEYKPSGPRMRTDLVRIEAKQTPVYGRSLDLLFSKPDEVLVPPGNYNLTYFFGDPNSDRIKTKIDLPIKPGETKEITIPVYSDKHPSRENIRKKQPDNSSAPPTNPAPMRLTPIHPR